MELRNRKIGDEPEVLTPSRKPRRRADVAQYSVARLICAWLVHLYTAMGLPVNLLCIHYALYGARDFALFAKLNWLAIFIDATDGTFARAVDIKKVVPNYDGAGLDNIIDFQTFSLIPALAVCVFEIVPGFWLQLSVAGAILIASAYQFCQGTAKTSEAFVGFPSYWNIVVFYIFYLDPPLPVTLAVFYSCAILSFIPIHFVYPTRTKTLFSVTLGGGFVWGIMMLVPALFPVWRYANLCIYLSFSYVLYYIGLSFILDARRRRSLAA